MVSEKNTGKRGKGKSDGDSRNKLTRLAECFWNVNAVERGMKGYCNDHELTVFKEITTVKTDKRGKIVLDKHDKKIRIKTGKFIKEVPMFANTAQVAVTAMLERLTEYITTVFVDNYPKSDDEGFMIMDRDKLMSIIPKDDGLNDFYNLKKYNRQADHSIPIETKQISKYINKLNSDIEIKKSALLLLKWLIATAYQETMKWAHISMSTFDKKTLSAKPLVKVVGGLFNDHLGNILTERMIQAARAVGKYPDDPETVDVPSKNTKKKSRGKKSTHVDQSDGDDSESDNDDNRSDSGNDSDSDSDDDNRNSKRRSNNKKRSH